MANTELPRRERVLPWEVNRREQPINDSKTTVPASAAQFFSTAALVSMERQFRYIRTVTVLAARLAQLFVLQYPEMAFWLYQQQFWYQCQDFVMVPHPTVRRPFENHMEVYRALYDVSFRPGWPFPPIGFQKGTDNWCHSDIRSFRALQMVNSFCQILTDGPVSWKLNILRTMATFFECPCPKKYASLVVNTTTATIPDSLRACRLPTLIVFDTMLMLDNVDLNPDNITFLFTTGLNILSFRENIASDTMRRNAVSPSPSYSPGFISFSQKLEKHFLSFNANHCLLKDPFAFFRKKKRCFNSFHFFLCPKKNKNRRKARELATTIASGEHDIPAKNRKRNSRLQQQVRPRQRRRTDDAYEPPLVDPIEYSFCATNHKNLCGYSIGSRIDNNNVDHQLSGLVLNPKARKIIHPPVLTHASPNCYFAENLHKYLNEVAMPLMWVLTQEEINNPDFRPRTILDQLLINVDRRALRRNKFDFFIRRQKRIMGLIEKIKLMANGRETIIWFGSGGDGPSRQAVKTPRKRFLKEIQKHFTYVKPNGDEFYTSAKTNCCKVFNQKLYHDDGTVNNDKFVCPQCQTLWSRDISASRNQLEIAISEHYYNERPEALETT
ncbi:hypothetical protein P9112_003412 [Eukaryota sp. TZLM1-RC]